mmetsp:Transcript_43486/g.106393  ORF Transcript_43486/g.106393 Transcript_43486/m.106393 type:complete len:238 (+) Transcript_43486:99-812(+)
MRSLCGRDSSGGSCSPRPSGRFVLTRQAFLSCLFARLGGLRFGLTTNLWRGISSRGGGHQERYMQRGSLRIARLLRSTCRCVRGRCTRSRFAGTSTGGAKTPCGCAQTCWALCAGDHLCCAISGRSLGGRSAGLRPFRSETSCLCRVRLVDMLWPSLKWGPTRRVCARSIGRCRGSGTAQTRDLSHATSPSSTQTGRGRAGARAMPSCMRTTTIRLPMATPRACLLRSKRGTVMYSL